MIIKFARIDDRLIHGQVATVWSKQADAERIIVVSQEVFNNDIRKKLLKQAAPAGMKVNVVDVKKAVAVYNNPKYADTTVFYLFTNPEEVLELVKSGVPLKSINIGGMRFEEGKTQITKAVSVTKEDIAAFKELDKLGIELDLRVLADDAKKDLLKLIDQKVKE
ncbi:PTS system mannose/fructose/N-acetylgalactosamine-transporter subunit IIB [Lactobacillus corticis]|uniref:Mannose/fructose/sorbose-specific PTS system IIB component n=1 Tax=Lactobacillus corticis TaxID=2201249 RepID=A0A916VHT4_9LACO|nr:mannose/fructose/sorbose PTS transporter subunit IIB [Lactobacillus corticis]GFZ27421.1 mannose/fructose/sorbose-specific PTS system IIB component [Lactobacillus corticis]